MPDQPPNFDSRLKRLFFLRRRLHGRANRSLRFSPPLPADKAGDLANRCAWYLRGTGADLELEAEPGEVPEAQARQPLDGVRIVRPGEGRRPVATAVWSWAGRGWASLLGRNAYLVDPGFHRFTESHEWVELRNSFVPKAGREALRALSRRNLESYLAKHQGADEAVLFTTGPSLPAAMKREYGDGVVRIACNSVVKDEALLRHIRPNLLCFSDYVFHFGPSRYAEEFRQALHRMAKDFPECFVAVPKHCFGLTLAHFPELRDRMVGLDFADGPPWRAPSPSDPSVRATGNVLTQLMVPMAVPVARTVSVIGADGRAPGETYFWKHAPRGQFADLMWTVEDCHPSFFRHNDYAAYYQRHCDDVAGIAAWAESQGRSFRSLTRSMTPALHQREADLLN